MSMMRLDNYLVDRGLAKTRSQAENYIKLGTVKVGDSVVKKPGTKVSENAVVKLTSQIKYVSRGALKLESAAKALKLNFRDKNVLDVGSSTGGFTDFVLQHGAAKVVAIDVGKDQLDSSLRHNKKIELHEQTDIRDIKKLSTKIDYCLIDVSFISIRPVLKHVLSIVDKQCMIVAMVKPQFETAASAKNKGVVKNEKLRRQILKDFEAWSKEYFMIIGKQDSAVHGPKGNIERFYLLKTL